MSYFRHKDNIIEIDNYQFDEEVLKQFDPEYKKPEGWIRCYIQGRKHYLTNGKNQIGDIFPWEDGDRYIKSVSELELLKKQIEIDKECSSMNE